MYSKPNILLVDDNRTNLFYVTTLLKDLDINIFEATSGHEALELSQQNEFSLALLDIQMPGMNGYELAMQLNNGKGEYMPIIFITATHPDNHQILQGYEVGAVDYITKPCCGKILISKIKVFLELHQQKKKIQEIAKDLVATAESLSTTNRSLIVSEEEYRALLNASPDGIVLVNPSGYITDVSQSARELFHIDTIEQVKGKPFWRFFPPGQTVQTKKTRSLLAAGEIAHNVEFVLKKTNGSLFPAEISATRIERLHGHSLSYMYILRDVSHRKNMETQLLHSERLANIGEMATIMAHEINQALNTISLVFDNMAVETIRSRQLSKGYFDKKSPKIFESIQRIKNTIDHVRALSRSSNNNQSALFDVNQSVQNALSLMSEQLRQYGIRLQLSCAKNLPQLMGNTFEFEQVIINLLSNARDALTEKKQRLGSFDPMFVSIRTKAQEHHIVLEVEDNGIGILPENQEKILLPFFSTKEFGKGTGLGLSIACNIVKKMNGSLSIQSEAMHYALIRIVLPV